MGSKASSNCSNRLTLRANMSRPCVLATHGPGAFCRVGDLQPSTPGFRNKDLRPLLAKALGLDSQQITQGKMSYDLRRLRLHQLIKSIPGTHRYQLTEFGRRTALFYSRTFNRVLRPTLSQIPQPNLPPDSSNLTADVHYLEAQLTNYLAEKKAA